MPKNPKYDDFLDDTIREQLRQEASRRGADAVQFDRDRFARSVPAKTRWSRSGSWRWTASVAGLAVVVIGGSFVWHTSSQRSAAHSHPPSAVGSSQYWFQPVKHHILDANVVRMRGDHLTVHASPTPAHPRGFTQTLIVTAHTQMWKNGQLRRLSPDDLIAGENVAVVTKTWPGTWPTAKFPIASEIFGPEEQVQGIITKTTVGTIEIRDIRFSHKNKVIFTGQSTRLLYNANSNFGGATMANLKPGYMVLAQIVGKNGPRLVETLLVSRPSQGSWIGVGGGT